MEPNRLPRARQKTKTERKQSRKAITADIPNVFEFQDYRKFLLAVIESRKQRLKAYSRKQFAKALGFSSHSGLVMILNGQRELRDPYLSRCVKNLRLNVSEQLYFETLIRTVGSTAAQKKLLLKEVELLSNQWEAPEMNEEIRLIDFFIVQQILCLLQAYTDAKEIQSLFRYPIAVEEVERVLYWMEEKAYVHCRQDQFKILKTVMMAKDEYPNSSLHKMHTDCFNLAAQSLKNDAIEDREFQTYVFTVKSKNFQKMKQRIKKMTLDIISEYETELEADSVVQMHFNLFEVVDSSKLKDRWQ